MLPLQLFVFWWSFAFQVVWGCWGIIVSYFICSYWGSEKTWFLVYCKMKKDLQCCRTKDISWLSVTHFLNLNMIKNFSSNMLRSSLYWAPSPLLKILVAECHPPAWVYGWPGWIIQRLDDLFFLHPNSSRRIVLLLYKSTEFIRIIFKFQSNLVYETYMEVFGVLLA